MSDATDDDRTVTIDASGRLVLPKAIRAAAGIEPGIPLRIRARDGRIEIEPVHARIRIVERDGIAVAETVDPMPPLPESVFRRLKREGRQRRERW